MAGKVDKLGGWAGCLTARLMKRLRAGRGERPRLELLERVTIGPRQTVALIEAEGHRFLVACAAEGAPAFYPLDSTARRNASQISSRRPRVSW